MDKEKRLAKEIKDEKSDYLVTLTYGIPATVRVEASSSKEAKARAVEKLYSNPDEHTIDLRVTEEADVRAKGVLRLDEE